MAAVLRGMAGFDALNADAEPQPPDRLFPRAARSAREWFYSLVNTGLRESNVCRREWSRESKVPEIGRSGRSWWRRA